MTDWVIHALAFEKEGTVRLCTGVPPVRDGRGGTLVWTNATCSACQVVIALRDGSRSEDSAAARAFQAAEQTAKNRARTRRESR